MDVKVLEYLKKTVEKPVLQVTAVAAASETDFNQMRI